MMREKNADDFKRETISKQLITLLSSGRLLNTITIKELTATVEMSRSNFYNYFSDVYDLLKWTYYNELLIWFEDFVGNEMHREAFQLMYRKVYNNKEFYLNIFKNERNHAIDVYMRAFFENIYERNAILDTNKSKEFETLKKHYYSNSMAFILTLWLESDFKIKESEVLEFSIYARHTSLHDMIKGRK